MDHIGAKVWLQVYLKGFWTKDTYFCATFKLEASQPGSNFNITQEVLPVEIYP